MSIINCTDKSCIYQKDGKCEFNAVVSGKISSDGRCAHYRASNLGAEHLPSKNLY